MIKTATYGICKTCGCTVHNPCYNPKFGFCWWTDESETVCSHCTNAEIKNDKETVHCVNDIPDWEEPEEIKKQEETENSEGKKSDDLQDGEESNQSESDDSNSEIDIGDIDGISEKFYV